MSLKTSEKYCLARKYAPCWKFNVRMGHDVIQECAKGNADSNQNYDEQDSGTVVRSGNRIHCLRVNRSDVQPGPTRSLSMCYGYFSPGGKPCQEC